MAVFSTRNLLTSTLLPAGLKCRSQVTGQVTGYRPQVRSRVTGHRSQATGQVTGHKQKIGYWTKLFWTDVLLYKNKILKPRNLDDIFVL